MRIEKLLLNNVLSVRAYNVCKKNNLSCVSEIIEYYEEKGTFKSLIHCGNKSNSELMELCEDLKEVEKAKVDESVPCDMKLFNDLNESDKSIINNYIENETKILSQRSNNAITKYLINNICLQSFCEKVYGNQDFQVMNLHNIGKGTIEEITAYLDNIENFILSVHGQKSP